MNKILQNPPSVKGFQASAVLKGIVWSLVITIILGIIVSLLLQYTALSESLLNGLSTFIFFISMFWGATIGARSAGCKGLLHGMSISILYLILIIAIGLVWTPEAFTASILIKRTAYSIISGILGGIIGIGLSTK